MAGSGGAAGVLLGGVLTSAFSWPWIFYVNVPVGAAVLAVSPWLVRESRADLPNRYFDFAGAATITSGLMLLVYGMTRATQHGWGTAATIGLLTASGVLIASFFLIESRSKAPLLPLRILRLRTLAGSNLSALITTGAVFSHVLPAHAVHAAGPALLGAQDRGRLHRVHADDHRLLGCLTRTRDEARSQERAARRVGALDGGARASSRNCRSTATTSATCSRASSSAGSGWPWPSSRCRSARSPESARRTPESPRA